MPARTLSNTCPYHGSWPDLKKPSSTVRIMLYRYLKIFLVQIIVLDFICLNGIFFLAGFGLRQYDLQVHQGADALLLVSNIAWAISLYTSGLYSVSQQLSYEKMA